MNKKQTKDQVKQDVNLDQSNAQHPEPTPSFPGPNDLKHQREKLNPSYEDKTETKTKGTL